MRTSALLAISGRGLGRTSVVLVPIALVLAAAGCAQAPDARVASADSLVYFIAPGDAETGWRDGDDVLAEWALAAWASLTDPPLRMVRGPEATASVRVYWTSAEAGLYGEMRARMVDGRLIAELYVHPDTDVLGPDIAARATVDPLFRDAVVYLTCVHELGHAFGLPHTSAFADIMYSFAYGGDFLAYFMRFREQLDTRDDIPRATPFSGADIEAFRALRSRSGQR